MASSLNKCRQEWRKLWKNKKCNQLDSLRASESVILWEFELWRVWIGNCAQLERYPSVHNRYTLIFLTKALPQKASLGLCSIWRDKDIFTVFAVVGKPGWVEKSSLILQHYSSLSGTGIVVLIDQWRSCTESVQLGRIPRLQTISITLWYP